MQNSFISLMLRMVFLLQWICALLCIVPSAHVSAAPSDALEKKQAVPSPSSKAWIGHWVDDQNNGTVVIADAGEGKLNIRGAVLVGSNHRGIAPAVASIVNGRVEFKDEYGGCLYRLQLAEKRLTLDTESIDGFCSNTPFGGIFKKVQKNTSAAFSNLDPDDHHNATDLSHPDISKWGNCDHQLFEYYSDLAPSFKKGLIAGKSDEKIFFYENYSNNIHCPGGDTSLCQKKSYLIAGDKVIILEHPTTPNQDFSCVLFLGQKNKETIGWIPSHSITSMTSIPAAPLQAGEWISATGDRITLSDAEHDKLKVNIFSSQKNAPRIETIIDKNQAWKEGGRVWLESVYLTFLESVIILNYYNPELQGIYVKTH